MKIAILAFRFVVIGDCGERRGGDGSKAWFSYTVDLPATQSPVLPGYYSDMRKEVASNRDHPSLYHRHACEVDSSSTSHVCRRQRPSIDLVAGGVMFPFVGTVSQVVPAALSQVGRRHKS